MGDFSEGFNKNVGIYYEKTQPEKQYGGPQSGLPPIFEVGQSLAPYLNIGLDLGSYSWRVSTVSKGEVFRMNPFEYSALVQDVLTLPFDDSKLVHSVKVLLAAGRKLKLGESVYSPIELAAGLFRSVKEMIEASTQKMLAKAVIAVPASFVHRQRKALIESAELAGVNVIGLINDHSAAALDYCFRESVRNGIFIVVSCGVYSFEIAVVDVQNGLIETKAIKADMRLSGFAANTAILEYVRKEHNAKDQQALHIFVDRLKADCAFAKKSLRRTSSDLRLSLTKSELSNCLHPMKKAYQTILSELLLESNIAISDLKGVIFSGEASKFWILKEAVESTFPAIPILRGEVSAGAAIQAALLVRELKDWVVWDVLASPAYVAQGERMKCVINGNSPTPINGHITLEAGEDGKAQAKIFQRVVDCGSGDEFLCVAKVQTQIPLSPSKKDEDGVCEDVSLAVMANPDGTLQFSARHKRLDTNLPLAVQDLLSGEVEPYELKN